MSDETPLSLAQERETQTRRFIVTTKHEGEALEEVMEFAATFNASDGGSVQLVRL